MKRAIFIFYLLIIMAKLSFAQSMQSGISISITDEQATPIPAAIITIQNSATNEIFQFLTDNEGIFIINSVPDGNYRINCVARNYQEKNISLNIMTGLSATIVVFLKSAAVKPASLPANNLNDTLITGEVKEYSHRSVAEGTISVKNLTSELISDYSFSEGYYCIEALPAGEYEIYVNCKGHNTRVIKLNLFDHTRVLMNIDMK
jgi:hypothetical protein